MQQIDFTGKVAVVTGAASGMGLMTSQEFARLGAKLVMCDLDEARLRQEVEELKSGGVGELRGQVFPCVGDVREFAHAEAAAKIAASIGGFAASRAFAIATSAAFFCAVVNARSAVAAARAFTPIS